MNHVVRHLGLCSGLMATSLVAQGADANLGMHTFAESMLYGGVNSGNIMYSAFIPNGNQSTDSVLLLELTQGYGTIPSTWQYYLSSAPLGAGAAGMVYSLYMPTGYDVEGGWTNITSADVYGNVTATYIAYGVSTSAFTGPVVSTFYGAVGNGSTAGWLDHSLPFSAVPTSNGEIALPFSYTTIASSQTCSISFNAFIDNRDYMQYVIAGINAANGMNAQSIGSTAITALPQSSAPYTAQTLSDSNRATITGSRFDKDFLGVGPVSGISYSVAPIYTYFDVTLGTGNSAMSTTIAPLPTFAAGQVCASLANQRLALNRNGSLSEFMGFIRIW